MMRGTPSQSLVFVVVNKNVSDILILANWSITSYVFRFPSIAQLSLSLTFFVDFGHPDPFVFLLQPPGMKIPDSINSINLIWNLHTPFLHVYLLENSGP